MTIRRSMIAALAVGLALSAAPVWANSLAVTNAAALTGSFGLEIRLDTSPQQVAYVEQADSGVIADETHVLARFQLGNVQPFRTALGNSKSFQLFQLRGDSPAGTAIVQGRLYFISKNGNARVRGYCKLNNGNDRFADAVTIPSGNTVTTVELEWTQGEPGSCCGRVIGTGGGEACRTDVNNQLTVIDGMRLGLTGSLTDLDPENPTVALYADTFESFR